MTIARAEYPRPHFDRSHSWMSCNGLWDFLPDPSAALQAAAVLATGTDTANAAPAGGSPAWPEQITVPFAWETAASGVERLWLTCGWYRRSLQVPPEWDGQHVVLHFGAVHHHARVWVNGTAVGEHSGGYQPFEFDITTAVIDHRADVLVRVHAPLDKRDIAHGKQRSLPRDDYDGCSFTPSSGIWQPVWLEARPATHITSLRLAPTPDLTAITATVATSGADATTSLVLRWNAGGSDDEVTVDLAGQWGTAELPVRDPRRWSPADPHLYAVTAVLRSEGGTDTVTSHTGLRSIRAIAGQLFMNGERLYVRGVLDQGYWPSTGITAPSDEAFVKDLMIARDMGFNLVRKHLKLEDPRFYHHADRLGMLVWAEPASTGRFTPGAVEAFEAQVPAMVARDANHPSIVIWGLYNEEWGLDWDVPGDPAKQQAVRAAFDLLKAHDRTRPAVDNSGWTHVHTDLVDWHVYDEQPAGWSVKVRALLGGYVDHFPVAIAPDTIVPKMLMAGGGQPPADLPNLNSEFGGGYTSVERGWNLRWQTQELRRHDQLAGYIWTELNDIEHETAGLVTFDRTPRDLGGNEPARTNAETVLVVDLTPTAPGSDLLTDGPVELDVHVSHHGPSVLTGRLVAHWGPLMVEVPRGALSASVQSASAGAAPHADVLSVTPFLLSGPCTVHAALPAGQDAARLTIALLQEEVVVATAAVDVRRNQA